MTVHSSYLDAVAGRVVCVWGGSSIGFACVGLFISFVFLGEVNLLELEFSFSYLQ